MSATHLQELGLKVNPVYEAYLRSPHWQKLKKKALARASWRCQLCGIAAPLEVHHRNRKRELGREQLEDLTCLCRDCHQMFYDRYGW